VANDEGKNLSG